MKKPISESRASPDSSGSPRKRTGLRVIVPNWLPLGLAFIAALGLYFILPGTFYYLVPLYIGLTFYLFCNVFRVGNLQESFWYVTFIAITLATFHSPRLYAVLIILICVPLQAGIIIWRLLNPRGGVGGGGVR